MNKIVLAVVSLLVGLGLGFAIPHGARPEVSQQVGGIYNKPAAEHFNLGFYAGSTDQFAVDSSGNASSSSLTASNVYFSQLRNIAVVSASSSSSTSASINLGAGTAGFFTIGTSTPATRIVNASDTSVTLLSRIHLTQYATTTIAGVTCNSTPATSTIITNIWPGSGFTASAGSIPTTNPNCYSYSIGN